MPGPFRPWFSHLSAGWDPHLGASEAPGAWAHPGDFDLIRLGVIAALGISERSPNGSDMQTHPRGHVYLLSQSRLLSLVRLLSSSFLGVSEP